MNAIRIALGCLAAALGAIAPAAGPGKFNKVLAIGDKAPAWTDLEGTDGNKHSLADLKDKDFVIVAFTCNSCPVAANYEDRMIQCVEHHAKPDSKVAFVAINVNTGKEDALPAMKERAKKKNFPFAYLYDPTQKVARDYGAMFTPEFFILDKDRKIAYTGAMDEKAPPQTGGTHYLENALKAVQAGKQPAVAETSAAAGCRIKFNPKRDDQ